MPHPELALSPGHLMLPWASASSHPWAQGAPETGALQQPAQSWQFCCLELWKSFCQCWAQVGHSSQVSCQGGRAGSCWQCREEQPWPGAPGAALGWRLLCYAAKIEIFPMAPQTFCPYLPVWVFFCAHLISEGFLSFYTLEDDTGSELFNTNEAVTLLTR